MVHGLVGDPLTWAAICGSVGALLWHHEHHFQRFTAWLFALASAFLVLAVPPWEAALAALLSTGTGMTVFIVLTLVFFVSFYLSAVRSAKPSFLRRTILSRKGGGGPGKDLVPYVSGQSPRRPDRYHRIWTPAVSIVTGSLSVIVFGGWKLIVAAAGKSAVATGQQLLQSRQQIGSGHAAASVPASQIPGIWIAGAAVLLVIVFVMRRAEKRRHGGTPQAGGRHGRGSAPMIGGG